MILDASKECPPHVLNLGDTYLKVSPNFTLPMRSVIHYWIPSFILVAISKSDRFVRFSRSSKRSPFFLDCSKVGVLKLSLSKQKRATSRNQEVAINGLYTYIKYMHGC